MKRLYFMFIIIVLLLIILLFSRYLYRRRAHKTMVALSQIGQNITSFLQLNEILEKFYENVNKLMSADTLGIATYDEEKEQIDFKLFIENSQKLPEEFASIHDETSISAWSIRKREVVFINDYEKEFSEYIQSHPVNEEIPGSIICIPLESNDKVLGLLIVKSLKKKAYSIFHLNILKTLAAYLAVAIDNANAYTEISSLNNDLLGKNAIIRKEKEESEKLLLNILPVRVAKELKENNKAVPEQFDDVTVFFSDIVGFTKMSAQFEPHELINELNHIFTAFDNIFEKNQCERIKTIGDAYLAVCGLPEENPNHAYNIVKSAIEVRDYIKKRNRNHKTKWLLRIGVHSGSVVGGVVGIKKYIYDVFGDTINTASRMEHYSEPMRVNVSEITRDLVKRYFETTERSLVDVKGKGKMKMYFVEKLKSTGKL